MFDKILKIIYSASHKYLIVESFKNTFKESTFTKNIQKKKKKCPTHSKFANRKPWIRD